MKKIGIFIENRFYDQEIIYYQPRFEEAGYEVRFLTRLWGNESITFKGMNFEMPFEARYSFENFTDKELEDYAAIIVPAGYVSDMLRYSQNPDELAPAVQFLKKIMNNKSIIKAAICHAMWMFTPIPEVIRNRKITCHNNLVGDVKNAGANYVNEDIVIDDDLITLRTGDMFGKLAATLISELAKRKDKILTYA